MRRLVKTALVSVCIACLSPALAPVAMADDAGARAQIDGNVNATLNNLYATVPGSRNVVSRAAGVLIFPDITKAGFIVGGERGDGALRVGGRSIAYYQTGGLSFGLQAGAEAHSMVLAFMTPDALQRFQNSSGWDVGADASVAIVQTSAGGQLEASQLTKPVQVFVFGTKGLMGGLSLQGTKISRYDI